MSRSEQGEKEKVTRGVDQELSRAKIDLASGGRDRWTVNGTLAPESLQELGAEADVLAPGLVNVAITEENRLWRVRGDIEVTVRMPCSRCLENYTVTMAANVDRFFAIGKDPAHSFGQTEMEEDIVFLESGEFSPLRFAEEEYILLIPMIPLCSENCRGLCQECGSDLNKNPCDCPTIEKENPFAVLGKLKL